MTRIRSFRPKDTIRFRAVRRNARLGLAAHALERGQSRVVATAEVKGQTVDFGDVIHPLVDRRVYRRLAANRTTVRVPRRLLRAFFGDMLPNADLVADLVGHDNLKNVVIVGASAVQEAIGVNRNQLAFRVGPGQHALTVLLGTAGFLDRQDEDIGFAAFRRQPTDYALGLPLLAPAEGALGIQKRMLLQPHGQAVDRSVDRLDACWRGASVEQRQTEGTAEQTDSRHEASD